MHFCNATRTFYEVKCSASHFPLENVMLCKNAFDAKMHLMPKCILAYIFQRKMFSVHFPKENVQLCKNAVFFALQKTKMLCKNAFLHHILFCKNAFLHQQNVTNAFDAKMHLMQKCIFATQRVHFTK